MGEWVVAGKEKGSRKASLLCVQILPYRDIIVQCDKLAERYLCVAKDVLLEVIGGWNMTQGEGTQAKRIFEQPTDAISFYSDFAQIVASENEVLLQFYETIPGPPQPQGGVGMVRTRLRATIMLSTPHVQKIGELILERIPGKSKARAL